MVQDICNDIVRMVVALPQQTGQFFVPFSLDWTNYQEAINMLAVIKVCGFEMKIIHCKYQIMQTL